MVSWQHRLGDAALRAVRFRHWYWARHDGIYRPKPVEVAGKVARGRTMGEKTFEGHLFRWFDPRGGVSSADTIIALHGGGYVAEASPGHIGAYSALADLTGLRVYHPHYPLAPFYKPDAITEWTQRFVAHVREHRPEGRLLMIGDSAGANLALQLTHAGVEIDRLVLWSPWLDVEGANPLIAERDGSCALLRAEGMQEFRKLYHGERDPRDPALSPIFREAETLPPTLILSGDRDLFHPDIKTYAAKRAGQGEPVELHTEPGVWHDYMLMPTPEARRALSRSAAFLTASDARPASP